MSSVAIARLKSTTLSKPKSFSQGRSPKNSSVELSACSFYAYVTLYVLTKVKRVTLAIRGVRWSDTTVAIITYLLAELSELKKALSVQARGEK